MELLISGNNYNWIIKCEINNETIKVRYFDYTKKEAIKLFKDKYNLNNKKIEIINID